MDAIEAMVIWLAVPFGLMLVLFLGALVAGETPEPVVIASTRWEGDGAPSTLTYRMYAHYRSLALLGYLALTAAGAAILVLLLAKLSMAAAVLPVLAWAAISLWNAYWLLFRIAHELGLDNGRLHWRSPLASGFVDLADLQELRRSRLGPHVAVLDVRRGRRVVAWVRKGFVPFIEALCSEVPGLRVSLGLFARVAEDAPGWRGARGRRGRGA